jgi:hypothetical protein
MTTALQEKRESTSKDTEAFATLKAAYDAGLADLAKTEELLQTLLTGLSSSKSDDDTAGGYMGQLADAKAQLTAAGTEAEQAKVKIGLAEKEIKEKEPRAKKAEKEGEGLLTELDSKRNNVEKIKSRLQGAAWDEEKERQLLESQAEHSGRMTELLEVRTSHRQLNVRQLADRFSAVMLSSPASQPSTFRTLIPRQTSIAPKSRVWWPHCWTLIRKISRARPRLRFVLVESSTTSLLRTRKLVHNCWRRVNSESE